MLADMIAANTTSRPLPDDRLTVGKWMNLWLRRQGERDDLRPNTVMAYDRSVRLLLPELGGVPLRRLVAGHVNPRQTATYVTVRDGLLARAAEAAEEAIG